MRRAAVANNLAPPKLGHSVKALDERTRCQCGNGRIREFEEIEVASDDHVGMGCDRECDEVIVSRVTADRWMRQRSIVDVGCLGREIGDESFRLVEGEIASQAWAYEHARDLGEQHRRAEQLDPTVERGIEDERGRGEG